MDHLAERLRTERERQRRSLRELSAETKIREPFLVALERGEYHVLPSVYVRSFIKTYAAALHIPAAEVTKLLDDVLEQDDDQDRSFIRRSEPRPKPELKPSPEPKPRPEPKSEPAQERNGASRRPLEIKLGGSFLDVVRGFPIWAWVAVLAVLVVAAVMWISKGSDADERPLTSADSAAMVVDVDAEDALETDSMYLRAEALDTAWINITSDNKNSYQQILLPGTEHRWSAMQQFLLSMSNAGGVVFYRDDVKLAPFGKKGESVRSITVTRREVKTPASAWNPEQQTQPPAAAQTPPPRSTSAKAVPKTSTSARARRAVEGPAITPAPLKPVVPNKR